MIQADLSPTHQEAHRLLDLGYRTLPISPETKRPLIKWKQYQRDEMPTHELIDQWFGQGLSTGLGITPTDMIVIDIDGGANPWPVDLEQRLDLLSTYTVETPRGGHHHYFRRPAGMTVKNTAGQLAHDVDVRTTGGLIVVPPTAKNNGCYSFVLDPLTDGPDELSEPPEWLFRQLKNINSEKKTLVVMSGTERRDIKPGARNSGLTRIAGHFRRGGSSEAVIVAALLVENAEFSDPLPDSEVKSIAASVAQYAPDQTTVDRIEHLVENKTPDPDNPLMKSPLRRMTQGELMEIKPPLWLINQLIPMGGLGVIVGKPGIAKSWLAQALADSVARDIPLLGNPAFPPTKSGYVVIALPESLSSWAKRTKSANAYHGFEDTDNIVYCVGPLRLADPEGWGHMAVIIDQEIAERGELPAMVIVDTLSASMAGEDENQQSVMTMVMSHLSNLTNQGITTILTHHPSKYSEQYRGSTVLLGSCDWMFNLTAQNGVRELVKVKLRDADDIGKLTFTIDDTPHGPVATYSDKGGPWSNFTASCVGNKELRDIFLDHGLVMPDGEARSTASKDVFGINGVTLPALRGTWDRYKTIPTTPTGDYQKEYGRRTTVLLQTLRKMVDGGILAVASGSLSKGKKSERHKAVIKQMPA